MALNYLNSSNLEQLVLKGLNIGNLPLVSCGLCEALSPLPLSLNVIISFAYYVESVCQIMSFLYNLPHSGVIITASWRYW